jgi:hypothetical protein
MAKHGGDLVERTKPMPTIFEPAMFWVVIDLNQQHSWHGPYVAEDDAKYKAGELAATSPGPKPVCMMKFAGAASRKHTPVFWTEPT